MLKKVVKILFLFLLFYCQLMGIEIEQKSDKIYINGNFKIEFEQTDSGFIHLETENAVYGNKAGSPNLPLITKNLILPNTGNYSLSHLDYSYDEIELNSRIEPVLTEEKTKIKEEIYCGDAWLPKDIVKVNKPVIMRGIRFAQITISPVKYNPGQNKLRLIKNLELELKIDPTISENNIVKSNPKLTPNSFAKIAESSVIGYSTPKNSMQKKYLFICPDDDYCLLYLHELKKWKNKLGYKVKIATLEETGNTNDEIKSYLQNAYDTWTIPPDYVILFGDVSGTFTLPSFYVEGGPFSEWDVTDHPYTMLEGDDYFPDIFIGRISFQTLTELATVINKIRKYEQAPYLGHNWFQQGLMVGCVDAPFDYFSPYETLMETREKLLNFNYTQVDTFISPSYTSPQQLANWINTRGYTFINYRGAGSVNYWDGSYGSGIGYLFENQNVEEDLSNGLMLPFVTSITCGGGDFVNENSENSFGELWLKVGSPGSPKGAIGFIGPSEHDTKTRFNNVNDMGIYQGITQHGMTSCAEIMLSGKIALHNNFPHLQESGEPCYNVPFYFYVYNLLGDPGLNIWTSLPDSIDFTAPDSISCYENYLAIKINQSGDRADFIVSITNDDSLITSKNTNGEGEAKFEIDLSTGTYNITASKYGYLPETKELIVTEKSTLQLQNYNFSDQLISGNDLSLDLTLKNLFPHTVSDLNLHLHPQNKFIEVLSDTIFIPELNAQDTIGFSYDLRVKPKWRDGVRENLILICENNEMERQFIIPCQLESANLTISDVYFVQPHSFWVIGEENQINLLLKNIGSTNTEELDLKLVSHNNKATVTDSLSSSPNINSADSSLCTNDFQLELSDSLITGEQIEIGLKIFKDSVLVQEIFFNNTAGKIEPDKPTWGDNDYIAIESTDTGNYEIPDYNWVELDPALGGNGNLITGHTSTSDGYIQTIQLPQPFPFFDRYYSDISICSNGYICMGETERIFFRNSTIPSGAGPGAIVAPFWDELEQGKIFIYYDNSAGILIIEWSDFKNSYDPEKTETFQVKLFFPDSNSYADLLTGKIVFQYKEINNVDQENNYATIGIESYDQEQGLMLGYSDNIPASMHQTEDETAILIKSTAISNFPFISPSQNEVNITLNQNETTEKSINLNNLGTTIPIDCELSFTHFSKGKIAARTKNRSVEGDFIFCNSFSYIAHEEDFLDFCLYHDAASEDLEGFKIAFPDFVNVIEATDLEKLSYNGETGYGAELSWGFNDTLLTECGVHPFGITVQSDVDVLAPIDLEWQIQGDSSGTEPHTQEGTISIPPDTSGYFWVTSPQTGDKLVYSTVDTIGWDYWGTEQESKVKLLLSRDGGKNWETLTDETENDGKFEFYVENPLSDNCMVRISSSDGTSCDNSEIFTITALEITYPNDTTVMEYSRQDSIIWTGCGTITSVDINLTANAGSTWELLAENIENSGKFYFTVPAKMSDKCQIKISESASEINNFSDKFFSIVDYPVEWIATDSSQLLVEPQQVKNIELDISAEDLDVGMYSSFLHIETNYGQIISVKINLTVTQNNIDPGGKLQQNEPNPFKSWTKIPFELNYKTDEVQIKIYNIKGRLIRTLNYNPSGKNEESYIMWDTTNRSGHKVKTGVYFYSLFINGKSSQTKKCLLVR